MNSTPKHKTATGVLAAVLLTTSACGISSAPETAQVVMVANARQEDNRTLEEKVDTDGDGEMSEDEIRAYASAVLLNFSDCMRSNGYPDFTDVVLEDLTEGAGSGSGDGRGRFLTLMAERGVSISEPNAIPTLQLCGEDLQDLQTFAPQPSDDEVAEREEQLLGFAACMREQGLTDWPDPDFAVNPGDGYGPELLQQFDIQSDEIQEAGAACQAEGNGFALEDDSGTTEANATDADTADSSPAETNDSTPEPIDRAPISPLIEGDTSGLNIAVVTRRDLIQTSTLSGTLGYGEQEAFPTNSTGIVTGLPTEGDIIDFGETVFEINNQPVLLLDGLIPQFRPFTINMSDGADIEQLERNLVQHGWAVDLDLTVDEDFTTVTRDAIKAMQLELGIEDTGRIALGSVAFSTTPIRISTVNVPLGQSINPQLTALSVSESDQRITLQLDAEDRLLLSVGDDVDIELPDTTIVAGTVTAVSSVATRSINPQSGATNDPTIEVTIAFKSGVPNGIFDAAPVDIIIVEEIIADVLTVPVPALVALSGGGHAVELIVEGGTQLIGVELGDFVDDIVEVRGDIQEGDQVVLATAS